MGAGGVVWGRIRCTRRRCARRSSGGCRRVCDRGRQRRPARGCARRVCGPVRWRSGARRGLGRGRRERRVLRGSIRQISSPCGHAQRQRFAPLIAREAPEGDATHNGLCDREAGRSFAGEKDAGNAGDRVRQNSEHGRFVTEGGLRFLYATQLHDRTWLVARRVERKPNDLAVTARSERLEGPGGRAIMGRRRIECRRQRLRARLGSGNWLVVCPKAKPMPADSTDFGNSSRRENIGNCGTSTRFGQIKKAGWSRRDHPAQ